MTLEMKKIHKGKTRMYLVDAGMSIFKEWWRSDDKRTLRVKQNERNLRPWKKSNMKTDNEVVSRSKHPNPGGDSKDIWTMKISIHKKKHCFNIFLDRQLNESVAKGCVYHIAFRKQLSNPVLHGKHSL